MSVPQVMRLLPEPRIGAKGQLTPKEATIMSLVVVVAGPFLAAAAHIVYLVPLKTVCWYCALCSWLVVASAWCFLLWRTRNIAIGLWNTGVVILLIIMVVCIVTQKDGEEFPHWGIGLLIKQGILWAAALSYFAVCNFVKWRRGEI